MKLLWAHAFFVIVAICKDISASGQLSVTSTPYQAAIFVPKIDNSYFVLGLNTIKSNQIAMSLRTGIIRQGVNDTNDKLVVTANIGGTVGLVFQLELQYLVLVQFDNYEIASINLTANSTYTSMKQLKFYGTGSVQPYVLMNGFSRAFMTQCALVFGVDDSAVYEIEFACGTLGTDWVSFNIILTKSPLIPQCPKSVIEARASVTANWTTQKQDNFEYFYGIQGIYVNGKLGRAHLDKNLFQVESGGDFDVALLSIDLLCFADIKYPSMPVWQIAVIAISCVLFVAAIALVIYFVIKAKREKEAAVAQRDNATYEMSGATLGIPSSLNPVTVQVRYNPQEVIPEEKKVWTKEELDEKFGSS